MRICFLAPANSAHIKKWCKWFNEHDNKTYVVSFVKDDIEGTYIYHIDSGVDANASDSSKIKYLFKARKVKKIITQINPDIVNVHYATSYGTVAALAGIKKYVLSVWGSDIYDFPNKSMLHKMMLKYSLKKATYLFSTSQAMADEAHKYTDKNIEITPFGVDLQMFTPAKRNRPYHVSEDGRFIVGTVKSLLPKYGIDYLIEAVSLVKRKHPEIPIELRIAGKGEYEKEYKKLAKIKGIDEITTWLGYVSQNNAAKEWANMDIAIIPSTLESESFGVSAVEAQACGTPVIISDIPGLMEATSPGKSSVVVPRNNAEAIAEAIVDLFQNNEKRIKTGQVGREYVSERYGINSCFGNIKNSFDKMGEGGGKNIDLIAFSPMRRTRIYKRILSEDFIVGTIKSLEPIYAIDYLIKAVAILHKEYPDIPIQLRIAGKGSMEAEYKKLARKLGIEKNTKWLGFILQEEAAKEWANMDIAIIPSLQESFGVSAVEAQACGIPVIIADALGMMEATSPGKSSIVISKNSSEEIAKAIIHLLQNEKIRIRMGQEGRKYISNRYEIDFCFRNIENAFDKMIREME